MSALTVTGTPFPDPLSFEYNQTRAINASLASGPAFATSTAPFSYIQQKKPAYTITTQEIRTTTSANKHHHSRTISSSILPHDLFQHPPSPQKIPPVPPLPRSLSKSVPPKHHSRQSSASTLQKTMQRQDTTISTISSLPRRSTSSGSTGTNSGLSYVALMRKQKATVWCDRAQSVDARTAAQQKAARQRAQLEVQSSTNTIAGGRTSTLNSGGVVGKIRHGGVPKAPGYVPANMSGAGVPVRLSANEMIGDEEVGNGRILGDNSMIHGRTGSGKSSTHSGQYRSGYPRPEIGRFSSTSTPPSGEGSPSGRPHYIPEHADEHSEYFSSHEKQHSTDEDSFGELKDMSGPNATKYPVDQTQQKDDLRRRGSVDERAMSMGAGVKLFVANPDLDDD